MRIFTYAMALALSSILLLILGCGGGGGGAGSPAGSTLTPYTVTGKVTLNGAGLGLVTLSISGAASESSDPNGNYSFNHLPNGSYTITPSRQGYTFAPASQSVTVNDNGVTANFTATAIPTFAVSGKVASTNGAGLAGVTVTATNGGTGAAAGTVITDGNGGYSIGGLYDGTYVIAVSHANGYAFTPATQGVTVQGADAAANFSAPVATHTVAGKVATAGGAGVAGVSITLADTAASYGAVTDASGTYTLGGIPDGFYSLTPALTGYDFSYPAGYQGVHVSGADLAGPNLTAVPKSSGGGSLNVNFGG